MIIALDGPSASGKSTTAAAVARALGFAHLDSGALYRGVTLVALQELGGPIRALGPDEAARVLGAAERQGLALIPTGAAFSVSLGGRLVDRAIRQADVTASVSAVSAAPLVRDWINARLRAVAASGPSLVVDGRDIGTVVFPEADLKVFLVALPETRARRRLLQRGEALDPGRIREEADILAARDEADRNRAVAPLRAAPDAHLLDGTHLSFEAQVQAILALARGRRP
jgi:cytidylate kinase